MSTTPYTRYDYDGIKSYSPIGFSFVEPSQIKVLLADESGKPVSLTYNVDYTVDKSTSTVTLTGSRTYGITPTKLFIIRDSAVAESPTFASGIYLDVKKVQHSIETMTSQLEELKLKSENSVKMAYQDWKENGPDNPVFIPPASTRAGKMLAFDSDGKLSPILSTDIQQKLDDALGAEENTIALEASAANHDETAKKWATGLDKDGNAVTSTDSQYHNNAKYFSELSKEYKNSARDWASKESGTVDGTYKSAYQYAKQAEEKYQTVMEYVGNADTPTTALGQIKTAKEGALSTIGEDNGHGARGNAISAISTAKSDALYAIGESNSDGARKSALEAIATAKNDAITAIGEDNSSGKRGDAISAIGTAKTEALSQIGQDNGSGARGSAISAISTYLGSTTDSSPSTVYGAINAHISSNKSEVTAEGTSQTNLVISEGTRQTGLVTAEGNAQVSRVISSGTAEVARVQGVYQSDLATIASDCADRMGHLKLSLTTEGYLHIEKEEIA